MLSLLGFTFYTEQTKDGQWTGYGTNGTVKMPDVKASSFVALEREFESQAVTYHCQADMGASWVTSLDPFQMITYVNLPCQKLSTEIAHLNIDYKETKTGIYDGIFDNRKAQYRVNVRTFKYCAIGKVIGIYTEPNLLRI